MINNNITNKKEMPCLGKHFQLKMLDGSPMVYLKQHSENMDVFRTRCIPDVEV